MTRAARAASAALFGAVAIILAFPTVGWAAPVLVAWVPLLVVARDLPSWRHRLLAGWLLGFVYQAVLFRWVVFTMQEMASLPWAAAFACLVAFGLWHGLLAGVFLALVEPARRVAEGARPWLGAVAVAVLWVALESVWPFLFPWVLGHALWQVGPIHATAALGGPEALSLLVMLVTAALVELYVHRRDGQRWRHAGAALALAGALLAFGVGWWLHLEATPPRRTLRVAAVQMNYTIEEKKHASQRQRRVFMERLDATLRALPADAYDLVVASEGAYPFLWDVHADERVDPAGEAARLPTRATRQVGEAIAAGPRTHAILGGLRRPEPKARTRNSAVHFTPEGRIAGYYDKNLLVPFGEYLPGTSLFPSLAGSIPGISDFAAGEEPCAFAAAGEPVACGICYESLFTGYTRDGVGPAALLVNLTIDVWFGRSTAPWFHLMGQSTRAAELGVPLVRSALTGISALVGADGVPHAMLPLDTKGVLEGEVAIRDVTTPYRVVGPWLRWLCLAAAAALLAGVWRRRRRDQRGSA